MKNRKALSVFVCTLLLSTCLPIKTENTNNFTAKELLGSMCLYALANYLSISIAGSIIKDDKQNLTTADTCAVFGLSTMIQIAYLELHHYYPEYSCIIKLDKKRFISYAMSELGAFAGLAIGHESSFPTQLFYTFAGAAVCGTGSDYILTNLFPAKNSPIDPSTLKKNTDELQQFINSKQSNNFNNNSKSN